MECLRKLFDFKGCNPGTDVLTILNPTYELEDAPRAWRKKLHQVLIQWLSRRQFYFEPGFYYVHCSGEVDVNDIYERAGAQ